MEENLASRYLPVMVYFALCVLIVLLILAASLLFPSKKRSSLKFMPYESGIETKTHLFSERFSLHHSLVALMFLVFDVEVVFLYPWAVVAKSLGTFAFFEMLFFLGFIALAFAYVWRKGGLQWE